VLVVVMVMMAMAVAVVVMPVMVMMVVMGEHHQAAVTMGVEQMVVVMADDPRAVMMERPGLARSRIADDERKRGHCRKQRFPEHEFLRWMMIGRRSTSTRPRSGTYPFARSADVILLTKPAAPAATKCSRFRATRRCRCPRTTQRSVDSRALAGSSAATQGDRCKLQNRPSSIPQEEQHY
jgi:hypothetical protein